jgi:predicted nucleic acid-binding protein
MAAFVPDASVCLAWCFEDEASEWTDSLLNRLRLGEEALVPAHWPMEVANALLMAVRHARLTEEKCSRYLDDLRALPIHVDTASTTHAFDRSLVLARQHKLTIYDAAYLEIAVRVDLPLATLDGDLRKAAIAEGVLLPRS